MKNFKIHLNYKSRNQESFLNTENKTDEYQDMVYKYTYDVVLKNNYNKIVDIGCGSAFKLFKYFNDYEFIGYELKKTVNYLIKKHPNNIWVESDFNVEPDIKTDIIICADVIEHILNPDELLLWISKFDVKDIIISTPNRDLLVKYRGISNDGPPVNPYHIREWSFNEFEKYIGEYFNIINHFNIDDECCQVIHCKK